MKITNRSSVTYALPLSQYQMVYVAPNTAAEIDDEIFAALMQRADVAALFDGEKSPLIAGADTRSEAAAPTPVPASAPEKQSSVHSAAQRSRR